MQEGSDDSGRLLSLAASLLTNFLSVFSPFSSCVTHALVVE